MRGLEERIETVSTSFISEVGQDMAETRQWRLQSQKRYGRKA